MFISTFIFGNLIGYIFGIVWVWFANRFKKRLILKGYHFHHSLFFVLAFLLALSSSGNTAIFFWGAGLGVIIQHTSEEGFIFITKDKS
jgi:NhaP-type Na+/H+ or K+/H+ antiporter